MTISYASEAQISGLFYNPISYTLTSNTSSLNEGQAVTFSLSTTGLANSTNVPYTISGSNITTGDFTGSPTALTGNLTLNATGHASVTYTLANDSTTEGSETFYFTLNNNPASNISVTIGDTSTTPAFSVQFKYGYCNNGQDNNKPYSSYENGPYSLTQGSRYNFSISGDRGAVVDLGATASSSSVTIYTGGSPYIHVGYHNGSASSTFTTWQSYAPVGDGTSYTAQITNSHRYILFGSGHGGYSFEGITFNSASS